MHSDLQLQVHVTRTALARVVHPRRAPLPHRPRGIGRGRLLGGWAAANAQDHPAYADTHAGTRSRPLIAAQRRRARARAALPLRHRSPLGTRPRCERTTLARVGMSQEALSLQARLWSAQRFISEEFDTPVNWAVIAAAGSGRRLEPGCRQRPRTTQPTPAVRLTCGWHGVLGPPADSETQAAACRGKFTAGWGPARLHYTPRRVLPVVVTAATIIAPACGGKNRGPRGREVSKQSIKLIRMFPIMKGSPSMARSRARCTRAKGVVN